MAGSVETLCDTLSVLVNFGVTVTKLPQLKQSKGEKILLAFGLVSSGLAEQEGRVALSMAEAEHTPRSGGEDAVKPGPTL